MDRVRNINNAVENKKKNLYYTGFIFLDKAIFYTKLNIKYDIIKTGETMKTLINKLIKKTQIQIKNEKYTVKTKTWYSIEEDKDILYIKCELSGNKVLVMIPDDELIYIGKVVENMNYERISDNIIKYNNRLYNKTGDGNQFVKRIEFGNKEQVEGKCIFEDYKSDNNIISLGILPDKDNLKADVYAEIIGIDDIKIIK